MNFLKKKLKGHKKGYDDDDDDDDYIPPVPPHPSEAAEQSEVKKVVDLLSEEPQISDEKQDSKESKESLKESKEEWQFFQQLTQRVQETVSKTQTALEKIKETSAADDIAKQAEINYDDDLEEEEEEEDVPASRVVAHRPELWLSFDEGESAKTEVQPASPPKTNGVATGPQSSENAKEEAESKGVPNLLDDFGFTSPTSSSVVKEPVVDFDYENDYLDDPFDTSFVDISVVSPKVAADLVTNGEDHAIFLEETEESEADPFDTSFVETLICSESVKAVKPGNLDLTDFASSKHCLELSPRDQPRNPVPTPNRPLNLSRYGSRDSISSIMSNPFLSDTDYYTSAASSGAVTPYSGVETSTGRRRSSTNPFEQSPESEFKEALEASAIAALTEDFYKAIGDDAGASLHAAATVQEPFDPFATIVDDFVESQNASKRHSVAAEVAHSTDDLADIFGDHPCPEHTLVLNAPLGASDVSDTSDIDDGDKPADPTSIEPRRKSSAFQMELLDGDKEEPPPKFEPLPDLSTRKASLSRNQDEIEATVAPLSDPVPIEDKLFFDPFETVTERDASSPQSPSGERKAKVSEDLLDDVGQPNKEAIGIDNEAFEDNLIGDNEVFKDGRKLTEDGERKERDSLDNQQPDSQCEELTAPVESLSEQTQNDLSDTLVAPTSDSFVADPETTGIESKLDLFTTEDVDTGAACNETNVLESENDPFDTQEFTLEKVQDSVPYTDTAAFDAFAAKFEQTTDQPKSESAFDPFSSPSNTTLSNTKRNEDLSSGFDIFDPFAPTLKPPKNTPIKIKKMESKDSFDDDDEPDFKIVIKAKMKETDSRQDEVGGLAPLLPPPPKTPIKADAPEQKADQAKATNEFDEFEAIFGGQRTENVQQADTSEWPPALGDAATKRTESLESPQTPLFDDDTSQPLEDFGPKYDGQGWEMYLRHPAKKKLTGNRYWKKIYVRLSENSVIQLYNKKEDNDPFQELPLQPCYSLSEISAQQYDQYGKIFTAKLQYIFYRERVGVRKGQIAKVMQGQLTSVGQIAKLGMPLEHAPQVSQLLKLGTQNYDDLKLFVFVVEDALFHLTIHRDRALAYKTEEIQVTVQDEFYVEQSRAGHVTRQLARVRLFLLAFINGMPTVEIGVNDLTRQGKEVVGRHDIIPVVTEEWIRLEACEFHASVMLDEFEKTRIIKLPPPDACLFELMRFRVRPPRNRELPLQVSTNLLLTKAKVELRCEVLVPGCVSKKYGQIPCEDISIRIHIPECWIYFFRTEKHLRYGSVKSASRRPGKIKGIERFLGATQNIEPTMLEASAGQAKYEHAFHSLVWRIPRLPKEGQGAYTQQLLVLRLPLTSFDQMPEKFYEFVHVEFTMPATTVSHAVVRSISVSNENPPEKFVRYVAKHEYKVEMSINLNYEENEYIAAAAVSSAPVQEPVKSTVEEEKESDESD